MTKEKAIKVVKNNWLDSKYSMLREALQTLIPELNESEDERTRKEMIDYFSQFKEDGIRGVDITPWIAYLEKQKEQKPKYSEEEYNRGYQEGWKAAEEAYNKAVSYHFPTMPVTPSGFGCDGTVCTNPQMDCINCPIKTTGGFRIQTNSVTTNKEDEK